MHRTILCIDDAPRVLMIYKRILEDHGYRVILASSGLEGLEALKRYPVDCILLDYQMPDMDGRAVIRLLRQSETPPPVILASGSDIPREVLEQADAFVRKPVGIAELLDCIEGVIGRTEIEHPPQQVETPEESP